MVSVIIVPFYYYALIFENVRSNNKIAEYPVEVMFDVDYVSAVIKEFMLVRWANFKNIIVNFCLMSPMCIVIVLFIKVVSTILSAIGLVYYTIESIFIMLIYRLTCKRVRLKSKMYVFNYAFEFISTRTLNIAEHELRSVRRTMVIG